MAESCTQFGSRTQKAMKLTDLEESNDEKVQYNRPVSPAADRYGVCRSFLR